jgi:hypothetical protein
VIFLNEEIFSSLIEISFVDTDLMLVDFDDFHSFQWNNLHNKPRRSVLLDEEEDEDEDELEEDEEEDDSFLEKRLFFSLVEDSDSDSDLDSFFPLDLDFPPDPEPLEPFFLPMCNFIEEHEEDSSV